MRRIVLTVVLFVVPLAAQVPLKLYYGVQTHLGQLERTDIDSIGMEILLDAAQNAGLTSIRDECWWSEIEKVKGIFTFPHTVDRLIRSIQRRGLSVLMILNYNNPLYAEGAGSGISTNSNRIAFTRYCQEVVKRYARLGVKCYEIWNEPNVKSFWAPQPSAMEYLQLLKMVYPSIKRIDSTVTVVAGATSPAEMDPPIQGHVVWLRYMTELFENDGGRHMDGLSFHFYRFDRGPEAYLTQDVQNLQSIVGRNRQLWITEAGYPTSSVWPNTSLEDQANYVARLYLFGRSVPNLTHIYYYDLRDDGTNAADNEANFGLLFHDNSPKPSYIALKTVTSVVGYKGFNALTRFDSTYVLSFGSLSDRVLAVWTSGAPETRTINTGMMNQVIYDRDGGRIRYALGDTLVTVTVTKAPQYIVATQPKPEIRQQSRRPRTNRR